MIFLYILCGVALCYVLWIVGPAVCSLFCIFSRKELMQPEQLESAHYYYAPYLPQMLEATAFLRSQSSKRVCLNSFDGAELAADWYDTGAKTLAVCLHGYRTAPLTNFCILGKQLRQMGCDLLLVQQRGHGSSGGKRSTLGLLESSDLLCWLAWVQEHTDAQNILLCGVSMGATTVALASDRIASEKVRAMILDCGFCSPYEQMKSDCKKWHLPGRLMLPVIRLCARWMLHLELKTTVLDSLSKTKIPALFLHGTADSTVAWEQGERAYAACASEKELLLVQGAQHTVSLMEGGEDAMARLRRFVETYTKSECA